MKYILSIISLLPVLAIAEPESHYQQKHCEGVTEYVLPDRSRVDCLTESHAIEYDFAHEWKGAIGQALWYAKETGKRAGIVLIIRSEKDLKHWDKLNSTLKYFNLPIDAWQIKGEDQPK